MTARYNPRDAYQCALEERLAGNDARAEQTRKNWGPYEQYLKEGPDVGTREFGYDHDDEAGRWKAQGRGTGRG